jgi:hypothetical protein
MQKLFSETCRGHRDQITMYMENRRKSYQIINYDICLLVLLL